MIRTLSLIHAKIPSIQNALRTEFPSEKKIYDSQILHRMIKKFQDERYGKDCHRICELMKLGNNAKNSGGEWQTDVNDTYQIIGTRFQSYRQKQYALQYGSYFALADGTYGTNKYGMTIFPWVTTDCLGYIN